jgi:hypothetical protein
MLGLHLSAAAEALPERFAALLCLFVTETLRRREDPGQWSWQDALAGIDPHGVLQGAARAGLVERGLAYWGRPLRLDAGGGRRFLHSLLFEAGIPAKLITSQVFADFLRHCQREIDLAGAARAEAVLRLVQDNAHRLPPAWRRMETAELVAELLHALQPLRRIQARHQKLPQDALDALPIDLSDKTVRALIDSLLAQPRAAAPVVRELSSLCRRLLVRERDGWRAEIAPPAEPGFLPRHIALGPPFSWQDHPDRVRLAFGRSQLAIIEHDGNERWLLRPLPGAGEPLPPAAPATCSLLVDGDEVAVLVPPGGEPLDELPWVFMQASGDAALTYAGTGSRAVREGGLFIAVDPQGGAFDGPAEATLACGPIAGTQRILFRIAAATRWCATGEEHAVRLQPDGGGAEPPQIVFDGRLAAWPIPGHRVFLGAPRIALLGTVPAGARLAWRPQPAGKWSFAAPALATGAFELAVISGGELLDRRRIVVLAEGAVLRARAEGEVITLRARGIGGRLIGIPRFPDAVRQLVNGELHLRIPVGTAPPGDLTVISAEQGGPELRHLVPVELAGGVFLDRDRKVVTGVPDVCFADLEPLAARAGQGGKGTLAARATVVSGAIAGVTLERTVDFIRELPVAQVQADLRRLHATTGERDLQIRLSVRHNGIDTAALRVAIHDCTLSLRTPGRAVLCNAAGQVAPRPGALGAVSLTRPTDPPILLPTLDIGVWSLPALEREGPWIIVGVEDLAGRVRPAIWPGRHAAAPPLEPLAAAAQHPEQSARNAAFDRALTGLAAAPRSADVLTGWNFLDASLELATTHAGAVFLDVLLRAARCPDLLATWLLRAKGAGLARLATLEEALPFSWMLVPLESWGRAVEAQAAAYREVGLDPALVLGPRLSDIADLCPSAAAGVWHAREMLGLPQARDQPRRAQLGALRSVIGQLVERDPGPAAWDAALDGSSAWQNLPGIVLEAAPHVAARCTVHGTALSARAIAAIRYCRDREPDSFSRRHLAAVMLQLIDFPPNGA